MRSVLCGVYGAKINKSQVNSHGRGIFPFLSVLFILPAAGIHRDSTRHIEYSSFRHYGYRIKTKETTCHVIIINFRIQFLRYWRAFTSLCCCLFIFHYYFQKFFFLKKIRKWISGKVTLYNYEDVFLKYSPTSKVYLLKYRNIYYPIAQERRNKYWKRITHWRRIRCSVSYFKSQLSLLYRTFHNTAPAWWTRNKYKFEKVTITV